MFCFEINNKNDVPFSPWNNASINIRIFSKTIIYIAYKTGTFFPHLNHEHFTKTPTLDTSHDSATLIPRLIRTSWNRKQWFEENRLSSFFPSFLSNRRRSLSRFSKCKVGGAFGAVFPRRKRKRIRARFAFVARAKTPASFFPSRCKIVYAPAVEAERLNRFSRTPVAIKTDTKVESNSVEIYPDGEAVIWPRWANLVSKRRANIPRL